MMDNSEDWATSKICIMRKTWTQT